MKIFSSIQEMAVARALQNGAVGVLPTDTIYGIVARAHDPAAVDKLNLVKRREHKSGTIIAASVEQLYDLGIDARQLQGAATLWPASLSVQVPVTDELDYLARGTGTVAVRVPESAAIRALLEQTGPLFTSSANLPGQPPAANLTEARSYFGDKVDFYVDGGTITGAAPSTIIRFTDDGHTEILRQGAVQVKTEESS